QQSLVCATWRWLGSAHLGVRTTADAELTRATGGLEKENELMSKVIILEFPGVTAEQYQAVNKLLGVDYATGEGDWPEPLESHTAALGDAGLVVVEVWESQEAQAGFMARLGPALAEVGLAPPTPVGRLSPPGRHH